MRDYIVTGLIFGLLPVCLVRPWIGILVWYWFGTMNPHRLTWDFAYSMPFAMWIGGAVLLGALFAKDRRSIPWDAQLTLVVLLAAYFTFTTLFAWAPDAAWPQWRKVMKILLMTFVATMFIYGQQRIRALLLVLALSVGFYGLKSILFLINTAGGGQVEGPPGSFLEGNTFIGLAFCMVLPLLVMLAREERQAWLRRFLYATAACTFVATIFTYSRGAYIGLAAVTVLTFLHFQRRTLAALILIPAILLAPGVLPDRVFQRAELITEYEQESSANQRLQAWTVAARLSLDYPVTGAGFEFEYSPDNERWMKYGDRKYDWALSRSSSAHSIFFQVLGQHGIIAFLLYLALLIGTLLSFHRTKLAARKRPDLGWLVTYATGLQLGFGGYLVAGAFLSSAYFDLAWIFIALSAVLAREVSAPARQDSQNAGSTRVPSSSSVTASLSARD
jgi:probable O-glycosylation ligase (exosortase A-associated)